MINLIYIPIKTCMHVHSWYGPPTASKLVPGPLQITESGVYYNIDKHNSTSMAICMACLAIGLLETLLVIIKFLNNHCELTEFVMMILVLYNNIEYYINISLQKSTLFCLELEH